MMTIEELLYMYFGGAEMVAEIDSFPLIPGVVFIIYFKDSSYKYITYKDFKDIINSKKWTNVWGTL